MDCVTDEHNKNVEKAPVWLVTFGDIVALMLTFFVMLYSTAKIPSEKWDAVFGPMADSLRFSQSGLSPNPRLPFKSSATTVQEVGRFTSGSPAKRC